VVLAWLFIGSTFWGFRMHTRGGLLNQYVTYWSFALEIAIMTVMLAWEIAFAVERFRQKSGPTWYEKYQKFVVMFVGVFLGTSTMVFVGSVFISVDAAVSLAPMIAVDSTLPLSNLFTHTIPFMIGIVMTCSYHTPVSKQLVDAHWCPFFYFWHARRGWVDILLDLVHFWGALILPGIWRISCDPESVYGVRTSNAIYMLGFVALFMPSLVLAYLALWRHMTMRTPTDRVPHWQREKVPIAHRA
jgi:hypothetical protein